MSITNAEFAKTLDMPAEHQAKAAAFADAKGLSLAGREVVAEYKDSWVGDDGRTRPASTTMIVTADAAMALALKAGRNFAPVSTEWTSDGKDWLDVWISATPPAACRVTFEVDGIERPVVVTHMLAEYTQGKLTGTQRTMPALMLSKATMQLGLRRIAPQALAGLYVAEEAAAVSDAIDAEVEHVEAVQEAVTPPSDKEAQGTKLTRPEQHAARKAELISTGKALRADCGGEAAEKLAAIINNMRANGGADLDKLTQAQLRSILAAAKEIRADAGKAPVVQAQAVHAPAAELEPVEPEPVVDAGTQAVVDELDAEFVI